jgi:hypothetical protein
MNERYTRFPQGQVSEDDLPPMIDLTLPPMRPLWRLRLWTLLGDIVGVACLFAILFILLWALPVVVM